MKRKRKTPRKRAIDDLDFLAGRMFIWGGWETFEEIKTGAEQRMAELDELPHAFAKMEYTRRRYSPRDDHMTYMPIKPKRRTR